MRGDIKKNLEKKSKLKSSPKQKALKGGQGINGYFLEPNKVHEQCKLSHFKSVGLRIMYAIVHSETA